MKMLTWLKWKDKRRAETALDEDDEVKQLVQDQEEQMQVNNSVLSGGKGNKGQKDRIRRVFRQKQPLKNTEAES